MIAIKDKPEKNKDRSTLEREIQKSVYDFIKKHFGEPLKHSDHTDDLIALIATLIVKSHDR